jgi:hypothetical protein
MPLPVYINLVNYGDVPFDELMVLTVEQGIVIAIAAVSEAL